MRYLQLWKMSTAAVQQWKIVGGAPCYAWRMPSTRLFSGALCLLLLSASPFTVCRRFSCAGPSGPTPTGPTLDMLTSGQGLLTLWYPDRDARAYVYVDAIGDVESDFAVEYFPVRIALQQGKRYVVRANVDDDASFTSEPFALTPDHREQEIVIRLTEHRMSLNYGFPKSELPTETGFVPLAAPAEGVPAAPVFVEDRGGVGWETPFITYSSSLLVDERGDVWFKKKSSPAREYGSTPEPAYRQIGRLERAVFERMKALRDDAAKGQLERVCLESVDGGSLRLTVHGGNASGSQDVVIAKGDSECQVSTSPAAKTIAAWMVALRIEALGKK